MHEISKLEHDRLHTDSDEKFVLRHKLQDLHSSCGSLFELLSQLEFCNTNDRDHQGSRIKIDVRHVQKVLEILSPYLRPELVEQCTDFLLLDVIV